MFIPMRPCARKTRWRKKRIPGGITKAICCIIGILLAVGLLFLCPKWLLVVIIVLLSVVLVLLLRC